MTHPPCRRGSGAHMFALLELLVVIGIIAIFGLVPVPAATAAVQTLISENFEDDVVGAKPPKNDGLPGTWQAGTGLRVLAKSKETGSQTALYDNEDSFNRYDMYGYLKADSKVTKVGQTVHAEMQLRF